MSKQFHFTARADDGKLLLDEAASWDAYLRLVNGKDIKGALSEIVPVRTNQQNRAWWGIMVPAFAEAYGDDNMEAAHYVLVRQVHYEMVTDMKGRPHRKCLPTHNLPKDEFSALWERAARFMAEEYGIAVPDPDPAMARI
jgi:hypothetical protein